MPANVLFCVLLSSWHYILNCIAFAQLAHARTAKAGNDMPIEALREHVIMAFNLPPSAIPTAFAVHVDDQVSSMMSSAACSCTGTVVSLWLQSPS